ncbi:hypothetical protein BH23THE1_BH23THE1_03470 [soil metagenome]
MLKLIDIIINNAEKGNLITTYCFRCNVHIWPPNRYCNSCFKKTGFRKINRKGVLLEKSFSNLPDLIGHYGVGEFSGVRMIGRVDPSILPNDLIIISQVSIKENKLNLEFSKIKVKN